jgi:plastocyanin
MSSEARTDFEREGSCARAAQKMKPRSRASRALPVTLGAALALVSVRPAVAETVNILWTSNPSVGGTTLDLQVGDTIKWDVQLGHDLSEMPDQVLFDACDFTGSALITVGPAITQTTFNTPGTHYFACSVGLGFHCDLLNMNVTVVVSEDQPAPVPIWAPGIAAGLVLTGFAALRIREWPLSGRGKPTA